MIGFSKNTHDMVEKIIVIATITGRARPPVSQSKCLNDMIIERCHKYMPKDIVPRYRSGADNFTTIV